MSSTPKHLALYHAFGWTPPYFAHVGLLLDKDGQKLSKRLKSTNIAELRDSGIFPETLTNFIALLGWSHHRKTDVMDLGDLIREVSYTGFALDFI
jgi:glutamyl-tRNA synthetase